MLHYCCILMPYIQHVCQCWIKCNADKQSGKPNTADESSLVDLSLVFIAGNSSILFMSTSRDVGCRYILPKTESGTSIGCWNKIFLEHK